MATLEKNFWDTLTSGVTADFAEVSFLESKLIRLIRNELNIPIINKPTAMLIEYALGFYFTPQDKSEVRSWITRTIRPLLLGNREDKLYELYTKPLVQLGLTLDDLARTWKDLVTYVANRYVIRESVVMALSNEVAKQQYVDVRDNAEKLKVTYYDGASKWHTNPLASLLSLYTMYINANWEVYWTSFNSVIVGSILTIRNRYKRLEPELLHLLLNELRAF